ncbi:putative zinc-binding protein [Desertivirga xinjiangensis]|uniref:putative zinc-binding protein n=1 Tax=Desertivirga xinjiangensis TaxID=539206 RepID=UPI00210B29D5|nr:putative zinc-binding protein [Pedobacter xinjiangensis]
MFLKRKRLVYSCSGCSSAAQMANYLAIQLDRSRLADMSCIAGLGGDVKKMVKAAKQASEIIAIDGCPLACAKACLDRHGLLPDIHYQLGHSGVKKKDHEDFDIVQAQQILKKIKELLK